MLGNYQQALDTLRIDSIIDSETRIKIINVANNRQDQSEVQQKVVQLMNLSAITICSGNLDQAKAHFDQALSVLELKIQTTDMDSKNLLPSYLVNHLIYFYIKTIKFKGLMIVLREL